MYNQHEPVLRGNVSYIFQLALNASILTATSGELVVTHDVDPNPGTKDVVYLWKSLMESKIEDPFVIGPILAGQDAKRPPTMCRKCFTGYRRCARLHVALATNLRNAAATLGLVCHSSSTNPPRAPKRPRLTLSSQSESASTFTL